MMRGRKAEYNSAADKQKAYRDRQKRNAQTVTKFPPVRQAYEDAMEAIRILAAHVGTEQATYAIYALRQIDWACRDAEKDLPGHQRSMDEILSPLNPARRHGDRIVV